MGSVTTPLAIIIVLVLIYLWATVLIKVRTRGRVLTTIIGLDHRRERRLVKLGVEGDPRRIAPKSGGEYIVEEGAITYEDYPSSWPPFMRTTVPCIDYERDNPNPIHYHTNGNPRVSSAALGTLFKPHFLRTMLQDAEENFNNQKGKLSPQKLALWASFGAVGTAGIAVYMLYKLTNQVAIMQSTLNQLAQ